VLAFLLNRKIVVGVATLILGATTFFARDVLSRNGSMLYVTNAKIYILVGLVFMAAGTFLIAKDILAHQAPKPAPVRTLLWGPGTSTVPYY
jgi:hypothetical protein